MTEHHCPFCDWVTLDVAGIGPNKCVNCGQTVITHEDTQECGVAGLKAARREREDE
jgi:ribosomal protein L32